MIRRAYPFAFCNLLLACLTPAMAFIWHQPDPDHWTATFAFTGPVVDAMARAADLTPYDLLGRMTVIVYGGLLLRLLHFTFHDTASRHSRLLYVTAGLLTLATCADVGTYWVAGSSAPALRSYFFWWVEVPAVSAAVTLTSIMGARALATEGHRLHSRMMASAVPVAVSATATFQYLPHGMLVGLAWSFWGLRPAGRD